jgi:hypothetical protein
MLLAAYLSLGVAFLAVLFLALRDSRPALAMACLFFLMYLVVRPVMLLTGVYSRFAILHPHPGMWTQQEVGRVLLITVVMTGSFLAGYGLIRVGKRIGSAVSFVAAACLNRRAYLGAALLVMAAFVAGSVMQVSAGVLFYPYLIFTACMLLGKSGTGSWNWLSRIVGVVVLLAALTLTEERRDWAVAAFALGWLLVIEGRAAIMGRLVVGLGLLAVVAFVAVALRTKGSALERLEGISESKAALAVVELELDFPLVYDDLVVLARRVPDRNDFLLGQTIVKPLVSWIPRDIWPGKPETFSRIVSRDMNPSFFAGGGSEPLTLVGELFWNFGWFGAALAALLGALHRYIDVFYLAGRAMIPASPELGRPVLVLGITGAAMCFYILRGPMDTTWLSFVGLAGGLLLARLLARWV